MDARWRCLRLTGVTTLRRKNELGENSDAVTAERCLQGYLTGVNGICDTGQV